MIASQDEFEKHARAVLRDKPGLLDSLLTLRKQIQDEGKGAWSKPRAPTAAALNSANRLMIDRAASLLGPTDFERVFGFAPTEKYDLFDAQALRSEAHAMKKAAKKPETRVWPRVSATPSVVTLKHLAAALAEEQELSKRQAEAILNGVVVRITTHLKKGNLVRIGGLGVLQVQKRAARMGRNPATGEKVRIKASKKVAFRAAKDLKESI